MTDTKRVGREPDAAMFIAGTRALAERASNFARYVWYAMYDAAPSEPDKARELLRAVTDELARATKKFPTWPTDPLHAVAIIGEEAGELTKAVLQAVYEPHKSGPSDVRDEAIQTAAMALRFLASMERYIWERGEQHVQSAQDQPQAEPLTFRDDGGVEHLSTSGQNMMTRALMRSAKRATPAAEPDVERMRILCALIRNAPSLHGAEDALRTYGEECRAAERERAIAALMELRGDEYEDSIRDVCIAAIREARHD